MDSILKQMQMEREKQNYDFENVQSQLDKALGQSTRMQKERETIQLEVDRLQDKYEKAQVISQRGFNKDDLTTTHSIKSTFLHQQMIMQRLQKERDGFQEETDKLHERIEFQQNQIAKMQRDKENVLSELELVKERWEKAHNSHQKLTVSNDWSTMGGD